MIATSDILNTIAKNSTHLSWIRHSTLYLTLHGSRCYGTNNKDSDFDFKGFCIPPSKYYLGFQNAFEQAELKNPNPDTVIYQLNKFFNLAADNNPSVIEVLFTDQSDHYLVTPLGQKVLDNRHKFLSKRCKFSFSGYAVSQAKKIISHRKWLLHPPKSPPTRKDLGLPEYTLIPKDQLEAAESCVKKQLEKFNFDFLENLTEPEKIELKSIVSNMMAELKVCPDTKYLAACKKIGLDDNFVFLMQKEREYNNKKREWDQYINWKHNRNKDRAALEEKYSYDCKNAYHLVRLVRMCKEILTTGKVNVKRPDAEELIYIRNGGWSYDKLMEFMNEQDLELDQLYKTSNVLPHAADKKYLDSLCCSIVEDFLFKGKQC